MRVLLVEDDDLIGCGIEAGLRQAGFTVDWARDGNKASLALDTTAYALVLLDLGLPKVSGMELLKRLRDAGKDVPVLIARCRALLRRAQGRSVEVIRYQNLTVNPAAQTVEVDTARVPLTSREWAILMQLLTNQGIPQSRSRLEESLYGWQEEIESNAIEVHVSNLRKKLGAKLIRTVRNIGYVVEKA
jgi:two-component system response regulator QseB